MEGTNLPKIDAPAGIDRDNEELRNLVEEALDEMESHLEQNRKDAATFTDVEQSLDEVLSLDNIRSVDVRARPFENPKVTLWLKDCPIWANDAWTDYIYPRGLNAYNGKTYTSFDVRPF